MKIILRILALLLFAVPARGAEKVVVPFVTTDAVAGTVSVVGGDCSRREVFYLALFATQHSTSTDINADHIRREVVDQCNTQQVLVAIGGK